MFPTSVSDFTDRADLTFISPPEPAKTTAPAEADAQSPWFGKGYRAMRAANGGREPESPEIRSIPQA